MNIEHETQVLISPRSGRSRSSGLPMPRLSSTSNSPAPLNSPRSSVEDVPEETKTRNRSCAVVESPDSKKPRELYRSSLKNGTSSTLSAFQVLLAPPPEDWTPADTFVWMGKLSELEALYVRRKWIMNRDPRSRWRLRDSEENMLAESSNSDSAPPNFPSAQSPVRATSPIHFAPDKFTPYDASSPPSGEINLRMGNRLPLPSAYSDRDGSLPSFSPLQTAADDGTICSPRDSLLAEMLSSPRENPAKLASAYEESLIHPKSSSTSAPPSPRPSPTSASPAHPRESFVSHQTMSKSSSTIQTASLPPSQSSFSSSVPFLQLSSLPPAYLPSDDLYLLPKSSDHPQRPLANGQSSGSTLTRPQSVSPRAQSLSPRDKSHSPRPLDEHSSPSPRHLESQSPPPQPADPPSDPAPVPPTPQQAERLQRLLDLKNLASSTLDLAESISFLLPNAAAPKRRIELFSTKTSPQPPTSSMDALGDIRGPCTICIDECELFETFVSSKESSHRSQDTCGYCGCSVELHKVIKEGATSVKSAETSESSSYSCSDDSYFDSDDDTDESPGDLLDSAQELANLPETEDHQPVSVASTSPVRSLASSGYQFLPDVDALTMDTFLPDVKDLLNNFERKSINKSYIVSPIIVNEDDTVVTSPLPDDDPKNSSSKDTPMDIETRHQQQDAQEAWNWNDRFQAAVAHLRDLNSQVSVSRQIEAHMRLMALSQDFMTAVKRYGKIIISEQFLPEKIIKPDTRLGGHAGGAKYVVQGILFKFASDVHGLYGSDFAAAKAAGHELQGLMAYFNNGPKDICLPLMALVDYLGFRLIAMILLPISSSSIIYGTRDAGHTVHSLSPFFNQHMARIARKLNITSHIGGINPTTCSLVHSATDIEGHYGQDGRFYLLDLARVFPPERPTPGVRSGHLYRLFRGEFVRSYPKPLCPDAYSGFVLNDPKYHLYNQTIEDATHSLHHAVIPMTARTLVEFILEAQEKSKLSPDIISEHLHRTGVNFRHIGRVALHLPQRMPYNAHRIFYIEAVARIIKNRIRQILRENLASQRQPTIVIFVQLVVDLLNDVFFLQNMTFWRDHIIPSLTTNFGFTFPLKDVVPATNDTVTTAKPRSFLRKLTDSAKRISSSSLRSDALPTDEISSSRHRRANSIAAKLSANGAPALSRNQSLDEMASDRDEDDALQLIHICLDPFPYDNHSGALILFKRLQALTGFRFSQAAHEKFASLACQGSSTLLDILDVEEMEEKVKHMNIVARSQGLFYYFKSRQTNESQQALVLLRRAKQLYRQALVVDPNHPDTLHQYAQTRFKILELRHPANVPFFDFKDSRVIETDRYYLRAIDLQRFDSGFLTDYAVFLSKCGRFERAEEYYLRSLEYNPFYPKGLYEYGMFLLSKGSSEDMEDSECFLQMSIASQRQQLLFEQGMLPSAAPRLKAVDHRRRKVRHRSSKAVPPLDLPPKPETTPHTDLPTHTQSDPVIETNRSKDSWRVRRRARKKAEKQAKTDRKSRSDMTEDRSPDPTDTVKIGTRLARRIRKNHESSKSFSKSKS